MSKLIVLKLDGDLENEIRATLEIGQENQRPDSKITAYLPQANELVLILNNWLYNYRSLGNLTRGIKAVKVIYNGSTNNTSNQLAKCHISSEQLKENLNNWLLSKSFRLVRDTCLKNLSSEDEARVLIRTSCHQLHKIPWHLWDLVDKEYQHLEVAFGSLESQQSLKVKAPTLRDKVKILAILGNSAGIDIEKDTQLLKNLPDAETTFLVEPQRQKFYF